MNLQKNAQWKLKELVQVGEDIFEGGSGIPLQLLSFVAPSANDDSKAASVWFLGGFQGPTKNDSHIASLVQRAMEKEVFTPVVDVFMTPVVNPQASAKGAKGIVTGGANLNSVFISSENSAPLPLEAKCLQRWAKFIQPKLVVTFSNGASSYLRYLNVPQDIVSRLAELSERSIYVMGTEIEDKLDDGTVIPRETMEHSFGSWCVAQGIAWIDFRIDSTKKSFDDVKDADWKPAFGPAIKWLLEGFRFNPPVEEPAYELPQVIPALEMPPEFANL